VVVCGACALFGVPAIMSTLSAATPAVIVTPIPLDSTETPEPVVTAITQNGGVSTILPKVTPKPTLKATPETPANGSSGASGIDATAAAEIDMAATAVAGTPQVNDDRYLVLAPGIDMALARIPPGEFNMGSADSDKDAAREEKPQHTVKLDDYWISVDDITVEEFALFVRATGYKTTAETLGTGLVFNSSSALVQVKEATWRQPGGPIVNVPIDLDYPVVQVSWDDANAFCHWASEVSERRVKLPSEAQWEKAARGTDGRLYPWGNTPPDATLLNFDNQVGNVEPGGMYSPNGDSPYGVSDMAGNVWQWTSSLSMPYPYVANDGREDTSNRDNRVLRGGAFRSGFITSPKNSVRSAARGVADPAYRNGFVSFRVVVMP
jgi:sulfatase modifying factor 1